MQAHTFPRTSGARNPIVIVRILGPEQVSTSEVPIVFEMIIRAQAGKLRGPNCFSNDS